MTNADEPSDGTERKWRSDFLEISRSTAPFPPADRQQAMGCQTSQQVSCMLLVTLSFFIGCTPSTKTIDRAEWPAPMAELISKYPTIESAITTIEHDAFVNAKWVWKIHGQENEIKRLIEESELEENTNTHVKFKELQQSIPDEWSLPNTKATTVYVSSNYGIKHQEGVHLLLVVRDPGFDMTYVLYEWIF